MADEFQEIASESFEQTLSLARSYGVACVVANQYPGQLPPKLIQALDSNCAVRLTGHLDSGLHLLEFDLLQDIEQPKFFLRPCCLPRGLPMILRRAYVRSVAFATVPNARMWNAYLRCATSVDSAMRKRTRKNYNARGKSSRLTPRHNTQTYSTRKAGNHPVNATTAETAQA